MSGPEECPVPENRLISPFKVAEAHHTDAFCFEFAGQVDLADFVAAFYTTWLFKLERVVLHVFAKAPTSDAQAQELAEGESDTFAVWCVEGREPTEILLGERSGRTKSWLAVEPMGETTRLWFGSIVVPVERKGKLTLGPVFDSLLGAHKVYSRLLLMAAAARLERQKYKKMGQGARDSA
ncbi:MAG: hypothetical protein ABJN14_11745 [Paracoccaceae bacterium]